MIGRIFYQRTQRKLCAQVAHAADRVRVLRHSLVTAVDGAPSAAPILKLGR